MIVRMLHYKVKPGKLDEYLNLFAEVEERVSNLEGLSFFKLFEDREDPNTLFLVQVLADEEALKKYNEIGPDEEYTNAVMPLIEKFDLANAYKVSEVQPLF